MTRTRRTLIVTTLLLVCYGILRLALGAPSQVAHHPYFDGAPHPLNIAHRGASASHPEHSWDAYDVALDQGADVLELDIRMTKDNVLVVAHDRSLQRIAGVPLEIASSTLDEMRQAAGDRAPVPLEDLLVRYTVRLNLEMKDDSPTLADELFKLLEAKGRLGSVIVASFHADVLEHFRAASSGKVATAAHFGEGVWFYLAYLLRIPMTPPYVALQIPPRLGWLANLGSPSFIVFAHAHGLAVHYWTIDDEDTMRALLGAGADGIMTNNPGRLTAAGR